MICAGCHEHPFGYFRAHRYPCGHYCFQPPCAWVKFKARVQRAWRWSRARRA